MTIYLFTIYQLTLIPESISVIGRKSGKRHSLTVDPSLTYSIIALTGCPLNLLTNCLGFSTLHLISRTWLCQEKTTLVA